MWAPFLRRKFGGAAYRALLGPLYGGLYASDPDRMPVRHALQRTLVELGVERSILWRMFRGAARAAESAPCSFRKGLGSLPLAIAERLEGSLRLETPVREAGGGRAGGWDDHPRRCRNRAGGCGRFGVSLQCGRSPPRVAPIRKEEARLSALRYNRLALVYLKAETKLHGLGYQVAFGESLETRGVTWNASLFARSGLYTAYLGGMKNPALCEWGDGRIAEIAREEFEVATGYRAEAVHVSRTRIPAWDETWDGLEDVEVAAGPAHLLELHGSAGDPG